ncbi:hypothetical protein MMC20_005033 [Loxospora ochrophaea]|nr:hypothetical protein [Loxospora ochrophaea]
MTAAGGKLGIDVGNEPGSRTSSVPLLGEGFSETVRRDSTGGNSEETNVEKSDQETKSGKRRFWGLGKKKEDDKLKKKEGGTGDTGTLKEQSVTSTIVPTSPMQSPGTASVSSSQYPPQQYSAPSSPGRNLYSSSPRLSSPASSQIFERNVQDDPLHAPTSSAIPTHITTENHIPPILDASSIAITDDHLNPDKVEIIMHSAHQPAAVAVANTTSNEATVPASQDEMVPYHDNSNDESTSNYGSLDANDVHRLSFISFADVVHAEHTDHSNARDSLHLAGAPSISSLPLGNRSPSPVRSPVSSTSIAGSPPLPGSSSFQALDSSPHRVSRGPGSPFIGQSSPPGGELTIETMRQALRKTGSGDLSGARSQPISAIGGEDGAVEQPLK